MEETTRKADGKLEQTSSTAGIGVEKLLTNRLSVTDLQSGERFLIDTGADISVLAVKTKSKHTATSFKLYAANGSRISTYGERTLQLNLGLRRNYSWTFVIADVKRSIIGADFLRHHNILVDLKGQRLIDGLTKLSIKTLSTYSDDPSIHVIHENHRYSDILLRYPDIQRPMSLKKPPPHDVSHHLETTGPPIFVRPRPLPPDRYIEAKKEFERLMEMGICRPSKSPWANPMHIVKKKDGQLRICGDYRRLNAMTIPDRYPIPRVQDFTYRLYGKNIFSKIDIKKAYYWIPMASDDDSQKTAITTPFGLFEFTSMTFGLRNAAQTFQRFMHQVLRGLDDFTFSYVDDLLIYSTDEQQHKRHLHEVFQRLTEYGLTINTDKSEFGREKLNFLGYHVSAAGIQPPDDKVEAISSFPKPKTIEELRRFLGMLNFYRDALPNQASKQLELNKLLHNTKRRDKTPITWTSASEEAFEQCRESIKEAATLSHPVPGAKQHIFTDASDTCMGAVLQQQQNSTWRPIAFFSKALNDTQRRYSVYDRELLAMYTAVKHFRRYIEGLEVVIHTDHRPLTYALRKAPSSNDTPKRERQLQFISQFCSDIQYVKGENNIVADTLSRVEEITFASVLDYRRLAEEQEKSEELQSLMKRNKLKFAYITLPGVIKPIVCETGTSNPRPYLPTSIRKSAFKLLHEISHPGIRNTRKQIAERYFWPNMNVDVTRWTRECLGCQKSKIQRHTVTPLAQFEETGRFDHIHVDIVGPLPPSDECTYILTMIDRCTKWPEAVPIRNITADTVARTIYEHWICRFGCPLRITTDQGRQFESALFHALMKKLGIARIRTTAYHPQSNGQIERWHRTLKAALMARGATENWTKEIATVLLGLRASLHRTTNLSPALSTYGSTLRLPADFFVPAKNNTGEPSELIKKITETMTSLAPSTRPKQQRTPFVHKDLSSCTHVFVRIDHVKKPLTPPYEGPYKVLERHEKYFKIQFQSRTSIVSLDRLKPAYLLHEEFEETTSPPYPKMTAPAEQQPYVTRSGRVVRRNVRFI